MRADDGKANVEELDARAVIGTARHLDHLPPEQQDIIRFLKMLQFMFRKYEKSGLAADEAPLFAAGVQERLALPRDCV